MSQGAFPTVVAIEVAAALIFRDGRVLLTQRRADDHLASLWEFPGGKREEGETFQECLRRELREELALEVEVGELVESITHRYPGREVHLRFFRCELGPDEPRPIACQALAWASPDELAHYEFPAADARLLETLRTTPVLWAGK